MKSSLFVAIALLPFLGLVGCSSSSGGTPGPSGEDAGVSGVDAALNAESGIITCQNDARVTTYAANLSKTSASGALTVTLVSATPAPPALQTNTWVVRLTDKSNQPIVGADLTISPFMPDHGHGTSVRAAATANSDGTYTITPLYFFMGGVWRVTIGLATDGGGSPDDQVQFFFCVEG